MWPLFQSVPNLQAAPDRIARRRYGVIEICEGNLLAVHLRPLPKIVSVAEVWWQSRRVHRRQAGDRCLVYYNQPLSCSNYLTVSFVLSHRDCRLRTIRAAADVLDQIAQIKGSDALLCEVSNLRISDRLLTRWGWESHVPNSRRRHFIKRFYGEYPSAIPSSSEAVVLSRGAQDTATSRSESKASRREGLVSIAERPLEYQ